ncbi:glycosyltransferase [Micropruina sp.]|uniref:glycosyltransferase n=1 Tax=Micropruina sp. TaxID=2737536 RepID=UPI0039E4687B
MPGVLVHEWIAGAGGSENVFEAMSRIYPDAELVCLWNDSVGRFDPARIRESWMARTPLRRSKSLALPFMPATWRARRPHNYSWALISSHLFAHHANFGDPELKRFAYIHSPARYIWNPELDRRGDSLPVRLAAAALKPIDRRRAHDGAEYAANSEFVRDRIRQAWGVDARVIYPPVAVEEIQAVDWRDELSPQETALLDELPTSFLLGASRFIPYKQLDLVIRTGSVSGLPVVLAGSGPEEARLRAAAEDADVPVRFVPAPSDALLRALYGRAAAYVFPAIEDFGIMPVEAMAMGTPVIARAVGGVTESVVDGQSGVLTDFASDSDLVAAVEAATSIGPEAPSERARRFSSAMFRDAIMGWVG